MKEQILVRVKGFGWDDVKHPWSKNNVRFTSVQLMNHFVQVILPMEHQCDIPSEPPMNFPEAPDKFRLGTLVTDLDVGGESAIIGSQQLVDDAIQECIRQVADGEIDVD